MNIHNKLPSISPLSWNNSLHIQEQAIQSYSALPDDVLVDFILPSGKKDCWENCAKILANQRNEFIIKVAPKLFEWLQDLNWPGTAIITQRLLELPPPVFEACYLEALDAAENDPEWKYNLHLCFESAAPD